MKTKKGNKVLHKGKVWIVNKILIPGRIASETRHATRDYIHAFPMNGKQILFRSGKTLGQKWKKIPPGNSAEVDRCKF